MASNATSVYILAELTGRGSEDLWVGGKRIEDSTVWKWTDGTVWDVNVTSWAKGRPDPGKYNDLECLKFEAPTGRWRDKKCNTTHDFLCSVMVCPSGKIIIDRGFFITSLS